MSFRVSLVWGRDVVCTAGKLDVDLTDDLSGLTAENLAALVDWRTFYFEHKVPKGRACLFVYP